MSKSPEKPYITMSTLQRLEDSLLELSHSVTVLHLHCSLPMFESRPQATHFTQRKEVELTMISGLPATSSWNVGTSVLWAFVVRGSCITGLGLVAEVHHDRCQSQRAMVLDTPRPDAPLVRVNVLGLWFYYNVPRTGYHDDMHVVTLVWHGFTVT